jgi:hypothetical protein
MHQDEQRMLPRSYEGDGQQVRDKAEVTLA